MLIAVYSDYSLNQGAHSDTACRKQSSVQPLCMSNGRGNILISYTYILLWACNDMNEDCLSTKSRWIPSLPRTVYCWNSLSAYGNKEQSVSRFPESALFMSSFCREGKTLQSLGLCHKTLISLARLLAHAVINDNYKSLSHTLTGFYVFITRLERFFQNS